MLVSVKIFIRDVKKKQQACVTWDFSDLFDLSRNMSNAKVKKHAVDFQSSQKFEMFS